MSKPGTALLFWALATTCAAADVGCDHAIVDVGTMREVIERIDRYDTGATTNQSRFVAEFLFALAARPALNGARSFQVQPDRFMTAWLQATDRARDELPVSMAKVMEFGQRFVVDKRPETEYRGPPDIEPKNALSVRVSWPDGPGAPTRYSYHDTLAEPDVRVRHDRVITYLLIDFGDWVAYENMTGIAGRPTTGALGAIFNLFGTARIASTRLAVADDDTQVIRTRAHKLFGFTTLATVMPDGQAQRGVPDDREDLRALARRLDARIEVESASVPSEPCAVGR